MHKTGEIRILSSGLSGFNEGLKNSGESFNSIIDVIREIQFGILNGWNDFKEGLVFIGNIFNG